MVDIKARLNSARAKLLRRSSGNSSVGGDDTPSSPTTSTKPGRPLSQQRSARTSKEQAETSKEPQQREMAGQNGGVGRAQTVARDDNSHSASKAGTENSKQQQDLHHPSQPDIPAQHDISVQVTQATPDGVELANSATSHQDQAPDTPFTHISHSDFIPANFGEDGLAQWRSENVSSASTPLPSPNAPLTQLHHPQPGTARPTEKFTRKQSLIASSQTRLIQTLLESDELPPPTSHSAQGFAGHPLTLSTSMLNRKIWVKRPSASATLVSIREDDLVDDVRDMILKKYANTLGRSFDAPDITLRIVPRDQQHQQSQRHSSHGEVGRELGPDESITKALDTYFPHGQSVEDALIIDVPQRRTPKPSPRERYHHQQYYPEELQPGQGEDYFTPMPAAPSPHLPAGSVSSTGHGHSMSVLTTGQVPPLPSPGRRGPHRPRMGRAHTSSPPTLLTTTSGPVINGTNIPSRSSRSSINSAASESKIPSPAPPIPTPPAADTPRKVASPTPPPRVGSPRPNAPKKSKKSGERPHLPAGLLDGTVPPINVLIVEDNIINLKLLEAFMKRLKVRWQTAMNGKEAVNKWRTGGFHLVLMDIQLPVMNGLEATKEIRRLERLNYIGVFSSSASSSSPEVVHEGPRGDDKLENTYLFKSPVIIVALTASSLQSDRHEALAAGCNDFLTKPVNFVWLERKVMEWGCMQALIDFDGWRKWKDFSQKSAQDENTKGRSGVGGGGGQGGKGGGKAGGRGGKDKLRSSTTNVMDAIAAAG